MAFRAKSEKMTASYRTLQATLRSFGTENTALSASKPSIQTKNRRKKPQFCPSGIQKHRTSHTKTSVLSRQNLRTLCQRSPYFWNFRPKNSRKQPVSRMWISATDGRLLASEAIFRTVFARFPSILLIKRLDLSCIIIPIHSAKANRKNPNIGFAYTLHRHRCAHTDAKPSGPFVT